MCVLFVPAKLFVLTGMKSESQINHAVVG